MPPVSPTATPASFASALSGRTPRPRTTMSAGSERLAVCTERTDPFFTSNPSTASPRYSVTPTERTRRPRARPCRGQRARHGLLGAVDERDLEPAPDEGLGHLQPDVAPADDDRPARRGLVDGPARGRRRRRASARRRCLRRRRPGHAAGTAPRPSPQPAGRRARRARHRRRRRRRGRARGRAAGSRRWRRPRGGCARRCRCGGARRVYARRDRRHRTRDRRRSTGFRMPSTTCTGRARTRRSRGPRDPGDALRAPPRSCRRRHLR